nr:alpha/beta hydrolase [Corynebacterium lactis]
MRSRPTVVFSGGVGVPAHAWDKLAGMLAESGFATVTADRPGLAGSGMGSGDSSHAEPAWALGQAPTLASETERLAAAIEDARAASDRVILVVHSAAGFFAEALALTRPSLVDAVVLVDTSTTAEAFPAIPGFVLPSQVVGRAAGRALHWAAGKVGADPDQRRLLGPARLEALLTENAAFRYWARDLKELRSRYPAADTALADAALADTGSPVTSSVLTAIPEFPALWPGKRASSARMRRAGERIHRRWQRFGPSRHVVLEPCGHMVMNERPGAIYEEILRLEGEIR